MLLILAAIESEEDRSKMERIFEEHSLEMHRQAYFILRDMNDAEDAVQNAMVSILKHLNKLQDPCSNATRWYVLETARNAAKDIYRRKRRRWEKEMPYDENVSKEDPMEQYHGENEVLKQIMELSSRDRDILMLKYIQGYGYAEIADILGISKEAAKKAGKRAKDRLENLFGKEELNND